jgi:UDP-glucose 4-epimerase
MPRSFQPICQQRILVTGASGFVGSHLCQQLIHLGAEVYAVSRQPSPPKLPALLTSSPSDLASAIQWQQGDLSDLNTTRQILKTVQPDTIFHLASFVSGSRQLDAVLPMLHSNLVSTVNLLSVAAEIGCQRFITAGSLEEPDNTSAVPCSPYAAAKWASSGYAQMFYALYQVPVVIARLFMIYGPGQPDTRKLIPYVILSLLRGETPQLSSGERPVDWIYVSDVVEGLLKAASHPNLAGQIIELGSGYLVTTRAVVEQMYQLLAPGLTPVFGTLPDRPMERVQVANVAQTQTQMDWQPKTPLIQGLSQTIDWYRQSY